MSLPTKSIMTIMDGIMHRKYYSYASIHELNDFTEQNVVIDFSMNETIRLCQ